MLVGGESQGDGEVVGAPEAMVEGHQRFVHKAAQAQVRVYRLRLHPVRPVDPWPSELPLGDSGTPRQPCEKCKYNACDLLNLISFKLKFN